MTNNKKAIYVLEEKGPKRTVRLLFNTQGEAEREVERGKKFWKELAENNKVPERTYTIKRYILDE